jgi:hypothetical protein
VSVKPKRADLAVAAAILCAAAALAFCLYGGSPRDGGLEAVVLRGGAELRRIDLSALSEPVTLDIDGAYPLTLSAERGRIRFLTASCPDRVCVHTGWLDAGGRAAACVPAGVLLRVEGVPSAPGGVDTVAS